VNSVAISVQQTDGNRCHAVVEEKLDLLPRDRFIEGFDHIAAPVDALRNLADEAPLYRCAGLVIESRIDVADAIVQADFSDVAKALGGEKPGARAAPRNQRVGGDRGSVREPCHLI
jgi:hypothetical protein